MIINAIDPEEYRIALVEDGKLEEFYTDSSLRELTLHNIYKGVVQNIEPSLQAVFISYGAERNGFMQINEIHPEYYHIEPPDRGPIDLRKAIRKGQEILVQVVKEPTKLKGAALTTFLSLAGRYTVLMPGRDHIGVSRKIENDEERLRLKKMVQDLSVPEGCGFIIRTVAEGKSKKEISRDLSYLVRLWEEIRRLGQTEPAPSLIHKEEDLSIKTVRDYFNPDIKEILIDNPGVYERTREYMKIISPRSQKLVKLHKEKRPIFSKYQIEEQTEAIYHNQVRLKSGGHIVINQTEAMVAIDVNSGRSTKEAKLEATAFKTNLEAAEEIARQLRLRDLGGLIVIDFIDMRETKSNREVEKQLKAETKKDKAKIDIGRISKFGLLEMSRQRLRPSIEYGTYSPCKYCGGSGMLRSIEATALSALRQISQRISKGQIDKVICRFHPDVADYLLNKKRKELLNYEEKFGVSIQITSSHDIVPNQLDFEFTKKAAEAAPEIEPAPQPGANAHVNGS